MIQKQIPISIVEKVPSLIPTTNSKTPANAIIMPAIFLLFSFISILHQILIFLIQKMKFKIHHIIS